MITIVAMSVGLSLVFSIAISITASISVSPWLSMPLSLSLSPCLPLALSLRLTAHQVEELGFKGLSPDLGLPVGWWFRVLGLGFKV